jgi:hypothetical protein
VSGDCFFTADRKREIAVSSSSKDALSTTLKVEDLRYELFNPVLIFKQQGVDVEL